MAHRSRSKPPRRRWQQPRRRPRRATGRSRSPIVDTTGSLAMLQKLDNTQTASVRDRRSARPRTAMDFRRPTKALQDVIAAGGGGLRAARSPQCDTARRRRADHRGRQDRRRHRRVRRDVRAGCPGRHSRRRRRRSRALLLRRSSRKPTASAAAVRDRLPAAHDLARSRIARRASGIRDLSKRGGVGGACFDTLRTGAAISNLLIVFADLGALGEAAIDVGEDGAHVGFRRSGSPPRSRARACWRRRAPGPRCRPPAPRARR